MIFDNGTKAVHGGKKLFNKHARATRTQYIYPHVKESYKMRAKAIKVLEESTETNFHDVGLNNGFSDITSKAQATEEKELKGTQIEYFYASKNTIKEVKIQPTEWKKIFVNHASGKRFVSKIYI